MALQLVRKLTESDITHMKFCYNAKKPEFPPRYEGELKIGAHTISLIAARHFDEEGDENHYHYNLYFTMLFDGASQVNLRFSPNAVIYFLRDPYTGDVWLQLGTTRRRIWANPAIELPAVRNFDK